VNGKVGGAIEGHPTTVERAINEQRTKGRRSCGLRKREHEANGTRRHDFEISMGRTVRGTAATKHASRSIPTWWDGGNGRTHFLLSHVPTRRFVTVRFTTLQFRALPKLAA
jgi:hypothetical protein